jgi:excinuclease UvrABC helicase subunit UvrB
MFGRRKNFNDIFREFDAMFGQFDSMFGNTPSNLSKENGSDELGDWTKETYASEDGSIFITNFIRTGNSSPKKNNSLEKLKSQLNLAIESENFEEAVKLRDQIKKFENNKEQLEKLQLELKKSISEQNFEKCIELREEIKKLNS